MAEYARTIPFLLIEHFVGSLFGIMILAPGCKANFCASVSSSAETSWIILLMSSVVNCCILWFNPVVGSSFIWVVTWCLHCLNNYFTSMFCWPMNYIALWGDMLLCGASWIAEGSSWFYEELAGLCWELTRTPWGAAFVVILDYSAVWELLLMKFRVVVTLNCFLISCWVPVPWDPDGGRKFCWLLLCMLLMSDFSNGTKPVLWDCPVNWDPGPLESLLGAALLESRVSLWK